MVRKKTIKDLSNKDKSQMLQELKGAHEQYSLYMAKNKKEYARKQFGESATKIFEKYIEA